MSDRVPFGFMAVIDTPIGDAVERTKEALKAEGFGVLTSIDVQDTMKQKLNVDTEPYVILGACNPGLAYRALQAEPNLGLLLPCNVTVRETDGRSEVVAVDPELMLGVVGENPDLKVAASEAAERLRRVVSSLAGEAP
jgi:uncharacterized protein (DUF302 family)